MGSRILVGAEVRFTNLLERQSYSRDRMGDTEREEKRSALEILHVPQSVIKKFVLGTFFLFIYLFKRDSSHMLVHSPNVYKG